MRGLPGRSFATKLTVLITLISALTAVVLCAALVVLEVRRVRHDSVQGVRAHARIIAANSTAALDFDDPKAGVSTLAGLAAAPEFAVGEIRKADGSLFARYQRGSGRAAPKLARPASVSIKDGWLEVSQPIVRDRDVIGTLTLLYDFAPAQRRLVQAIALAAAITLAVILLAWLAARQLQRSLLRPVQELSRAAETIAATEDYQIKARKYDDDELGRLTDVFNAMIGRIREAEILRRDHQAMLEREVQRRTAEVIETQSRLRQSERMASLGTLSAGLGHDIGNILMPLRAHLTAIREMIAGRDGAMAERAEDHFTAVSRAAEYLQNLSAGLRLMAQDPEQAGNPRERTNLAEWWTTTDPLLRATVGSGIKLEHEIPPNLPSVPLSRHLLTQAVFNLVQNAAMALRPDDGPPAPGALIRIQASAAAAADGGPQVCISVADNGMGMTEEVLRRCVEPYFTTRTRRMSSGLGLALVKGIVESAGGTLLIESNPGEGSTFTICLPAQARATQPREFAIVTLADARKRAIVSHLLTNLNYRVHFHPGDAGATAASPDGGLWVTDSFDMIPGQWSGRIVLLGRRPGASGGAGDRVVAVDETMPLPALRRRLEELLSGTRR